MSGSGRWDGFMPNIANVTKAERARRRVEGPWWTPVPDGGRLEGVAAFLTVQAGGILVSLSARYDDPLSNPGSRYKEACRRWEARYHILTPARPTVGTLLRVLSHSAWDMSTSPQAMTLDGQDPLPGL